MLVIVVYVLPRCTASDDPFGIFISPRNLKQKQNKANLHKMIYLPNILFSRYSLLNVMFLFALSLIYHTSPLVFSKRTSCFHF
jgi:hypothetical protein